MAYRPMQRVASPVQPNREELAWAAGFFDGEGCIRVQVDGWHRKTPVSRIRIEVNQVDPRVLHRFQAAVFGIGGVMGPYQQPKRAPAKPYYSYRVASHQGAQAVMAALWPFLSPVKREQARGAFLALPKKVTPHR